jgi:hypothetical protein
MEPEENIAVETVIVGTACVQLFHLRFQYSTPLCNIFRSI